MSETEKFVAAFRNEVELRIELKKAQDELADLRCLLAKHQEKIVQLTLELQVQRQNSMINLADIER